MSIIDWPSEDEIMKRDSRVHLDVSIRGNMVFVTARFKWSLVNIGAFHLNELKPVSVDDRLLMGLDSNMAFKPDLEMIRVVNEEIKVEMERRKTDA